MIPNYFFIFSSLFVLWRSKRKVGQSAAAAGLRTPIAARYVISLTLFEFILTLYAAATASAAALVPCVCDIKREDDDDDTGVEVTRIVDLPVAPLNEDVTRTSVIIAATFQTYLTAHALALSVFLHSSGV